MKIIKKIFIAFSFLIITCTSFFFGFAKIYFMERERCMLTYKENFAQFHYEYACNENHEYPLQQNKILRRAVTVQ
ncbi:MAG: hypothetical protein LBG17_06825 [Bacteroidales bacterium]|nr:hypothetical protein [Bacteroidales bacterium]